MRDISEYRRAIEAFRESQAHYRTLLEAIPGGVFVLNREFRFVLVNSALCRILKAPESEILYTGLDTLVPDIGDTAFSKAFREAMGNGRAGQAVDELRSRDGERVFYEINVYPVPEGILGIARNIPSERSADERSKGNDELFRLLVQSSSDVILVLDGEGRVTFASPSIERVFGRRPESIVGERALDYVHLEDRPNAERALAEAMGKPGIGPAVEFRVSNSRGAWVFVEANANNLLDEPRIKGIVVNARKIEERTTEIQTLRENEKLFRSIVETAPSLLLISNREGKNIFVSSNCEEITGWSREELLGGFVSWVHEDDAQAARRRFDRAIKEGEEGKNFVYKAVKKNGEIWYASSSWVVARDGEGRISEILLQTIDITQTVKAFELHAESEKKYRILVENANEVIVILQDGVIQFANPRACEMTGFGADELQSRPFSEFIHPSDLRLAAGYHEKRLRGEPVPSLYEIRLIVKGGRVRWAQVSGVVIPWNGRPATMNFLTDITEKKLAEEALRGKENELRQSQKMDAIGRLAGGIAHDFNNLLTAIIGYTEILTDDRALAGGPAPGGGEPGRAALGHVREIRKAADRAASLTRQLLAFSRKQILQPKVLNLSTLVAGVCALLRRLIGGNIELGAELDPDLAAVKADPGQIEQVIMNLVINARDAMPDGGVLTIRTRNASPGHAVKGFVLLEISDTGCGMDAETKKHLFEPFFTTKEKGKGTGLGLATVYGIVKQSRGFIFVSSETGKGTTFRIYFPRSSDLRDGDETNQGNAAPPFGRETVLLVDADGGARDALAENLKGFGYTVLTASDPIEAIALADNNGERPVDLIVTKQAIPGLNVHKPAGAAACGRPSAKVLFMSECSDDVAEPHSLAMKVRETLDGPVQS
jgi:PAS domain S-box-containing protein